MVAPSYSAAAAPHCQRCRRPPLPGDAHPPTPLVICRESAAAVRAAEGEGHVHMGAAMIPEVSGADELYFSIPQVNLKVRALG